MLDLQTVLTYLTLISIPVGVAYHIMTLNSTRKSQELAQKAREAQVFLHFSNIMANDRFIQGGSDLRKWDPSKFLEWRSMKESSEEYKRIMNIDYIYYSFEDLGGLVRGGYLSVPIIAYTTTGPIKYAWEKIAPYVEEIRELTDNPRNYSELEYLYNEVMKYHKEHPELAT